MRWQATINPQTREAWRPGFIPPRRSRVDLPILRSAVVGIPLVVAALVALGAILR